MIRLLALLVLLSAAAHAVCRVDPQGTVPLDIIDGHILVSVQVNDVPATFILDTGAERTLMGEDVVRRMGIERDGWVASVVRGVGGRPGRAPVRRASPGAEAPRPGHAAGGRDPGDGFYAAVIA